MSDVSEDKAKDDKTDTKSRRSVSKTYTIGDFLSNSKEVKQHSNYLEESFRRYCREKRIHKLESMDEWLKLFNKFAFGTK